VLYWVALREHMGGVFKVQKSEVQSCKAPDKAKADDPQIQVLKLKLPYYNAFCQLQEEAMTASFSRRDGMQIYQIKCFPWHDDNQALGAAASAMQLPEGMGSLPARPLNDVLALWGVPPSQPVNNPIHSTTAFASIQKTGLEKGDRCLTTAEVWRGYRVRALQHDVW
jgi:hypothetical protein